VVSEKPIYGDWVKSLDLARDFFVPRVCISNFPGSFGGRRVIADITCYNRVKGFALRDYASGFA